MSFQPSSFLRHLATLLAMPVLLSAVNVVAADIEGLSCTSNTLGFALDSTSCFYNASANWRKVILQKDGATITEASLAGSEGGFCLNNLLWLTPSGSPISDWSAVYNGANSVAIKIIAERENGDQDDLGSRTAYRSQYGVDVTADKTFPLSGPQASATFTAITPTSSAPNGANMYYQWTEVLDYAIDGYGHHAWSTPAWLWTSTASIELPAYGEKYPSYPARWGANSTLHVLNLRAMDSFGRYSTAQCLATVTAPQLNGDPAQSGSGSQLLRGADVASGNYHLSATDLSVSAKGPDLTVTRAYNSNITKTGAWTFNLDMRIWFGDHSMGREITIGPREDGRKQYFYRELDGSWQSLNPGNFDELVHESDGSYTLYTQGNLLYRFADPLATAAGRLESIKDRDGNVLRFSHTNNRITGATDAMGNDSTITRDGSGRITRVADHTNRYVEYTWNASDMITAVRNLRGETANFIYSGTDLTQIKDQRGNVQANIAYFASGDNQGWVNSIDDNLGHAWTFNYDTDNDRQATAVTRPAVNGVNNNLGFILDDSRTRVVERLDSIDAGNHRSKRTFQSTTKRNKLAEMALVKRSEKPNGAARDIVYSADGQGNPRQMVDALQRKTAADYAIIPDQPNLTPLKTLIKPGVTNPTVFDKFTDSGKPSQIKDSLNQISTREFNPDGRIKSTVDARKIPTAITYDDGNRKVRTTHADNSYSENTYDELGRVIASRNERGFFTFYSYDQNSNVKTISRPLDGVHPGPDDVKTENEYDQSDNFVSTTDPRGNITTYVYDTLNRKIEERYTVAGQQRVRRFEYDAMGRLYKDIDEKDNATEKRFDAKGRVLTEIDPLSHAVTCTYDTNGNIKTIIDAEGRTVICEYDVLDRKTAVIDALGNTERYEYDDQGLVKTYIDARGQITRYEYDSLGRMTKVIDADGKTTLATYDPNGNLVTTVDRNGKKTTYIYDPRDRLIRLTDPMSRSWSFTYDAGGNLLSRTTPAGKKTTYSYDPLDRLVEINYPGGPTVGIIYDENGNRLTMTDSHGTTSYTYDERNQLTEVTNAFSQSVSYAYDETGLLGELTYPDNKKVAYQHDDASRLSSLTDWLGHTTSYTRDDSGLVIAIDYGNGAKVEQGYDATGSLTTLKNWTAAHTPISSHDLTLDGNGNPTAADLDLPLLPTNLGKAADMLYDASNRLTKVGAAAINHDTDGRLVSDNSGPDPIQYAFNAQDLITSVSKKGALTDSYAYDGDGRRIQRISGGHTTRYLLDPTGGDLYRVLAESDGNNTVQNYYIYGDGLVSQISGSDDHHYYHFDQSGNTLALTDTNGTVTDSYAYEPFGNTTVQGTTHNPFRFVGKHGVIDDGNGLLHMRARYYRPDLRRFVSLDVLYGQVDDPLTLNRYQYVSGNPMAGIDPSGYEQKTFVDCLIETNPASVLYQLESTKELVQHVYMLGAGLDYMFFEAFDFSGQSDDMQVALLTDMFEIGFEDLGYSYTRDEYIKMAKAFDETTDTILIIKQLSKIYKKFKKVKVENLRKYSLFKETKKGKIKIDDKSIKKLKKDLSGKIKDLKDLQSKLDSKKSIVKNIAGLEKIFNKLNSMIENELTIYDATMISLDE